MKYLLLPVILFFALENIYSQGNTGRGLPQPTPLVIEKDSTKKIVVQNGQPFVLAYGSVIPVKFKLTIKNNVKQKLRINIQRPLRGESGTAETVLHLAKYILNNSTVTLDLTAINDRNYIEIKNADTAVKGNTYLTVTVTETSVLPLDEIVTTKKDYRFFLNKYSKSYTALFNSGAACIADVSMLFEPEDADISPDIHFYDSLGQEVDALNHSVDSNKKTFSFPLDKGRYYILAGNKQFKRAKDTLNDDDASTAFYLRVDDIKFAPALPYALAMFKEWMVSVGLAKYLKMTLYNNDGAAESNWMVNGEQKKYANEKYRVGTLRSIVNIKDSNERKRMEDLVSNDFDMRIDCSKFIKEAWYDKNNEPTYFLLLSTTLDGQEMSMLEHAYFTKFNNGFWLKIFDKLRLYSGVAFNKTLVHVPIECSGQWVYSDTLDDIGYVGRHGVECASASSSRLLVDFSALDGVRASPLLNKIDIGNKALGFMKNDIFNNSGATFEFLDSGRFSFSVIVRNVKGYILKGDDKWERIEIKCFIREGDAGKYLQVETDGLYTGGLGAYPKDSQFDKSFEPRMKQNLSEFSDHFVTAFKTVLLK